VTERSRQVDLLTGAWTQPHFEDALARAVSDAHRSNQPLCLFHLDVDDWQEHSDMRGETAIAEAFSRLAMVLGETLENHGPIGRFEIDSFEVFATCSKEKAYASAEYLRVKLAELEHSSEEGPFRLTVSIGVAMLRPNEPWGNLAEAARGACLKAKQGGRDRVAIR
jgi:diguanylate cyclase (GGDEF)-like protein